MSIKVGQVRIVNTKFGCDSKIHKTIERWMNPGFQYDCCMTPGDTIIITGIPDHLCYEFLASDGHTYQQFSSLISDYTNLVSDA